MGALEKVTKGIVDGVTGAIEDLGEAIGNVATEIWGNTIGRIDDILADVWSKLTGIPQALIRGIMYMFRDPKFWQGILLFLGLVGFAHGITAAADAPMGYKTKAFMEAAEMAYGNMHVKFLTSGHKLAYLFSPTYRKSYQRIMAEWSQDMYDMGVDAQLFGEIIGDIGSMVEGFSALIGKDWDEFDETWAGYLAELSEQTGETLESWGKDPNNLVDWLDEHIVIPEHNKAAKFMRSLSTGLGKISDVVGDAVEDLETIADSIVSLAGHVDELYGTDYLELIKEDKARLDDILFKQWDETQRALEKTAEIFEVRTINLEAEMDEFPLIAETASKTTYNSIVHEKQLLQRHLTEGL